MAIEKLLEDMDLEIRKLGGRLYSVGAADAILEGRKTGISLPPGDSDDFIEVKEEPKVKVAAKKKPAAKLGDGEAPGGDAPVTARPKAKPKAAPGTGE